MNGAHWKMEPVRVSPLIRRPYALLWCMGWLIGQLTRWSFLVAGICWGFTRHQVLSARETAFRAKEEAERPAREAAIKAEKDRKYKEEMDYLGRETGVIPGGPSKGSGAPAEHKHGVGCGCINK